MSSSLLNLNEVAIKRFPDAKSGAGDEGYFVTKFLKLLVNKGTFSDVLNIG